MISLDVKPEVKTSSSPLDLSPKDDKSTLSFSALLKGISKGQDEKPVQNGSLVLSFGDEVQDIKSDTKVSKNDILLSLLKGNKKAKVEPDVKDGLRTLLKGDVKESPKQDIKNELPFELNPKLTESISVPDLKILVKDAKIFLKEQILASDGFKRSEIKELPKTLKGLAQMAKTFGIDVSKITIEDVQSSIKPIVKDVKIESDIKPIVKDVKVESDIKPIVKDVKVESDIKPIVKDVKVASDIKPIVKDVNEQVVTLKEKVEPTTIFKAKKIDNVNLSNIQINNEDEQKVQENSKMNDKKVEISKEIKHAPLFKAQIQGEHTTEQLVQAKSFKVERKTPKQKADETLKVLLGGEKANKKDTTLTADFSVASAKVIAPQAKTEVTRGLESLLNGDITDASDVAKLEGLNTNKADSFEVKINEAKQMVKYLSQDVKSAIEDYKSPFTRIKVQLNPQQLGEIDLTVVQRGKNLHISLSSNNAAINTLALNANDLKTQLSNNGINNATLNFNNNSQSDNSQAGQQQQRQQQQNADEEYNYFENQETNEEVLSSLEIVVSRYA